MKQLKRALKALGFVIVKDNETSMIVSYLGNPLKIMKTKKGITVDGGFFRIEKETSREIVDLIKEWILLLPINMEANN